jgi:hypothetical protein
VSVLTKNPALSFTKADIFLRDRWECVKSATEEFVDCCERGHFREIKERIATTPPEADRE